MAWLAACAVGMVWLLQTLNAQPLLAVPAPAWVAVALLVWCLCGGRAACLLLVAGWTLCRADWLIETRLPRMLAGRDIIVRGVVCDFPRIDPEAMRLILLADADTAWWPAPERIHLSWYEDPPPMRPGERWQLRLRLKPPRGLRNPGAPDFEQWLYVRGIAATGYVRRSRLNRRLPAGMSDCPVGTVRGALATRIEQALGTHPAGAYVLAVAVGATHKLTPADWDLLRDTGTTHLLAISGLNIAMIAAPFLLLGPFLPRLSGRLAGRTGLVVVPALLAAAAYAALAGFAVSTIRALVMVAMAGLLILRRRRVGVGDLLGTAALVVVLLDPAMVMSPGFWLSFVAVGWLLLTSAAIEPDRHRVGGQRPARNLRHRLVGEAWAFGRAQFVLGLGLAPLSLAIFGRVSIVAPLTNLLAVPVFSLAVMPLTLLGTVLLFAAPASGTALLGAAAGVTQFLLGVLRWTAEVGVTTWRPPPPAVASLLLATAGALLLCWWRPAPLRALGIPLLLPLAFGMQRTGPALRVTVMDVGQGLAVLVETAQHTLVYDAGPALRMRDAGESVVVPVLRAANIRRLDALVISHYDQDHAGGAATIMSEYPRTTLIAGSAGHLHPTRFIRCVSGLSWDWDGVRFEMLSPEAHAAALSDNDGSCLLRIATRRASVMLPGDIERRREIDLVRRGLLHPTDLVVAAHHGSRSSSSAELTEATRPRFVVYSAGYLNRWGFPAAEVRHRWQAMHACGLETAENGALVFAADEAGELQLVHRERTDAARLWTVGLAAPEPCPPQEAGLNSAALNGL